MRKNQSVRANTSIVKFTSRRRFEVMGATYIIFDKLSFRAFTPSYAYKNTRGAILPPRDITNFHTS